MYEGRNGELSRSARPLIGEEMAKCDGREHSECEECTTDIQENLRDVRRSVLSDEYLSPTPDSERVPVRCRFCSEISRELLSRIHSSQR